MMNRMEPSLGEPLVLVISSNHLLIRLVRRAVKGRLGVVVRSGHKPDRDLLQNAKPRLVVLDDSDAGNEGVWMVKQVKRFAPDAGVLYLAANHTAEFERRVRAAGVVYYGSFDLARLVEVFDAFAQRLFPCSQTNVADTSRRLSPVHRTG